MAQFVFNYSEIEFVWNTISMQKEVEKWKHSTLVSFNAHFFMAQVGVDYAKIESISNTLWWKMKVKGGTSQR